MLAQSETPISPLAASTRTSNDGLGVLKVRSGATFPVAVREKTRTLEESATASSASAASTLRPPGGASVVAAPVMERNGAALPDTVREKTRIAGAAWSEMKISPALPLAEGVA